MSDDARPCCGNCHFWLLLEPDPAGQGNDIGECRRYPPSVPHYQDQEADGAFGGVWPESLRNDWCGEHRLAGPAPVEPPPFEDALVSLSGRAASALTAPRREHYSHPECWYGLGVRSWDELRAVTASDLARVYKLWQKSVAEIREWAGRFGVRVQF